MDKVKLFIDKNKELFLVISLVVFVMVAIWGYGFEQKKDPIRIAFETKGGPVIFDHRTHASPDGYDLSCEDCHHNYSEEQKESAEMNCRKCHYSKSQNILCNDATIHKRCIGYNCLNCHSDGLEDCKMCHE